MDIYEGDIIKLPNNRGERTLNEYLLSPDAVPSVRNRLHLIELLFKGELGTPKQARILPKFGYSSETEVRPHG